MSAESSWVFKMGFGFGLWDTFYDNRNGDRASVRWPFLDKKGYLLKAISNPIHARCIRGASAGCILPFNC